MLSQKNNTAGAYGRSSGSTWFKLVNMELVDYSEDYWSFRKEVTAHHLLIVADSEWSRIVVDGHTIPSFPGMVLACRPGQRIELGLTSEKGHSLYLLHYEAENTTASPLSGSGDEFELPLAAGLCLLGISLDREYRMESQAVAGSCFRSVFVRRFLRIPHDCEYTATMDCTILLISDNDYQMRIWGKRNAAQPICQKQYR
jgi:hypothetical protein